MMTLFKKKIFFVDPYFDWISMMAICLIVATILVLVGAKAYFGTESRIEAAMSGSTAGHTRKIDTDLLDATLKAYAARAVKSDSILKSYSGASDPSI
jgi:hypothetical protein